MGAIERAERDVRFAILVAVGRALDVNLSTLFEEAQEAETWKAASRGGG